MCMLYKRSTHEAHAEQNGQLKIGKELEFEMWQPVL